MMTSRLLFAAALAVCSAAHTHAQTPPPAALCDDRTCLVEAYGGAEPAGEVFSVVCTVRYIG